MKELNLYQKLLKITEAIGKIEKTGRNNMQNYTFIEQSKIVGELRPLLAEYGVFIKPETISRDVERYEVTRSNGKQGVDVHVTVNSKFTVINADKPDEQMICEWDAGEAIDSSDKATNKAVTASNKTFLMKLFNISDQDDGDANSPQITTTSGQKVRTASQKQINWLRTTAERELGLDSDAAINEFLGFPIDKLPQSKVKAAVDKITATKEEMRQSANEPVAFDETGAPITLDNIPY
jgi:hypothetical protein